MDFSKLQATSKITDQWSYPQAQANRSGLLAVSPGSRPELATAAILNAGMPMLSIYPLLSQKFGQEGLSAAALVAATTLSFFTVSGLLWVLGT